MQEFGDLGHVLDCRAKKKHSHLVNLFLSIYNLIVLLVNLRDVLSSIRRMGAIKMLTIYTAVYPTVIVRTCLLNT
jgi:hypothetical protein